MKAIYNISILLALFSLFSCTEIVNFDLSDQSGNSLVVEGSITTETKAHTVKLSRTADYYYNKPAEAVQNATVTISSENENYVLTEKTPGVYQTASNVAGTIGKTYTLDIYIGSEHYTAKSKINRVSMIDSITYQFSGNQFFEGEGGRPDLKPAIKLYFYGWEQASPNESMRDFYKVDYLIDNKLESDTLSEATFVDDTSVDGNYIHDWDVFTIEEEKIAYPKSLVTIKMYSIPKEYYDFYVATMLETTWKGSMFDGPPANVPTNLSNGARGFFYAASVASSSINIYKKAK